MSLMRGYLRCHWLPDTLSCGDVHTRLVAALVVPLQITSVLECSSAERGDACLRLKCECGEEDHLVLLDQPAPWQPFCSYQSCDAIVPVRAFSLVRAHSIRTAFQDTS